MSQSGVSNPVSHSATPTLSDRPEARTLGSPVPWNINRIEPGQQVTVTWCGQPVWAPHWPPEILERPSHDHRLQNLCDSDAAVETPPPYAQNATRPEYLVVASCTHLSCVPTIRPEVVSEVLDADWMGGYFYPCHGSRFDLAGRVTKNGPARTHSFIPPHRLLDPDMPEIGVDHAAA